MVSRADPRAGRTFVGSVLVLAAAARRGVVSADARCLGTVLGRTVPGRVTRVPENEPLPAALLCTYSIPRDRVGWTFRARMEIDLQRQLRGGVLEVSTDEGTTTRWIVQP